MTGSGSALRAVVLSLLASGAPLLAASVVVVLSSDADPYRKSLIELTKGINVRAGEKFKQVFSLIDTEE